MALSAVGVDGNGVIDAFRDYRTRQSGSASRHLSHQLLRRRTVARCFRDFKMKANSGTDPGRWQGLLETNA
jgi:hypothetical protein